MKKTPRLTVYYDGLCRLCSAEIEHYRKQPGSERIIFTDITEKMFNASEHGLDPFAVHRVMHAKDRAGHIHTKMSAFIEIWKTLPKYQVLALWAQYWPLRPLLDLSYEGFAKIRPYLPRKPAECQDSPYCELKK